MPATIEHIESLISHGRYIEARINTEEALKTSQELRYKQLYALAVSKSGMPETALAFLEPVYSQFPDDPESAGILGSIYKELFKKNQNEHYQEGQETENSCSCKYHNKIIMKMNTFTLKFRFFICLINF